MNNFIQWLQWKLGGGVTVDSGLGPCLLLWASLM